MTSTTPLANRIFPWFLLFLATIIFLSSLRFLNFQPRDILLDKPPEILSTIWYKSGFYGHVIFGMIPLVIGPFQFMTKLRNSRLSLHRMIGKIYLLSVWISGLSGLVICWFATGGWISAIGFFMLSILWLGTGYKAYATINIKDIASHQKWMIRNYALTFAAVTLRLGLLLAVFGIMEFLDIYRIVAWASWILNLLVAEWIISRIK
jgi:uncharacterized membrane protein